nr:hypothetical protein [Candidatus Solirubrobacter pratensis]
MVWHLFLIENELVRRLGDGLGISADDVHHPPREVGRGDCGQRRHRLTR